MYLLKPLAKFWFFFVVLSFNASVFSQTVNGVDEQSEAAKPVVVSLNSSSIKSVSFPQPDNKKPNKKMLQEATINLQTTVTGNQEQPKVLYILPWQSPASDDVDFEMLQQQTQTIFGHIEREELRRELESINEQ